MAVDSVDDLREYCVDVARRAKRAAAELTLTTGQQKNDWLRQSARLLGERSVALAEANRLDLAEAADLGLTDARRQHCQRDDNQSSHGSSLLR